MENKTIGIEEAKEIEVDILKYVDRICKENGLRYYLAFGTLIGAVRHEGFIPWDDDIDIWVPVDDYFALIDAVNREENKYYAICSSNNSQYLYSFAKIIRRDTKLIEPLEYPIDDLGVYIDVFPLIGLNESPVVRFFDRLWWKYLSVEWRYASLKQAAEQSNPVKKVLRYLPYKYAVAKGKDYWLKKLETFFRKRPVKGRKEIAGHYIKQIRNFTEEEKYMPFEGGSFPVPSEYHNLLTLLYGDYMQLPPPEKRVYKHSFDAFYR